MKPPAAGSSVPADLLAPLADAEEGGIEWETLLSMIDSEGKGVIAPEAFERSLRFAVGDRVPQSVCGGRSRRERAASAWE